MNNEFHRILFLLLSAHCLLLAVNAQTPTVEKVEPPSWWTASSVKTVRIMIRGSGLSGARVESSNASVSVSNPKASANGHYLFFDLSISESAKTGSSPIKITTANGTVNAPFEIFQPLPRTGNFQGFLPDDVIYSLVLDRFADGDAANNDPAKSKGLYDRKMPRGYHGGDLQGVITNFEYIKSLGATAVLTTPVYDNSDKPDTKQISKNYDGYGAIDLYGVDEHLGDMLKLKEFVRKAHQSGLIVFQDQIVNHVSPDHIWTNDPPTPTWFNGTTANHLNNNGQKWTAMNPRATFQTQAKNVDGWLFNTFPDLNQNDTEVEKYLIQNSLWWIAQTGFDAVRVERLPNVPRAFWSKWMSALRAEFPKVTVLGDINDSDPALLWFFQGGRVGYDKIDTKFDTLSDVGLFYSVRNSFGQGKPLGEVSRAFARDWLYANPRVLTTFIGTHNQPRFMNEPDATIEGLKLAQTLIMTSRGTPLLFYGDEIAMNGGAEPDNHPAFPGGFANDRQNAFTAQGRNSRENDVWSHLAGLGALRKELKPLQKGETFDLLSEEQQTAFARVFNNQAVLVVLNNDTKPAEVVFEVSMIKPLGLNAALTDRLGKISDIKIQNGKISFTMPARVAGIFTVK